MESTDSDKVKESPELRKVSFNTSERKKAKPSPKFSNISSIKNAKRQSNVSEVFSIGTELTELDEFSEDEEEDIQENLIETYQTAFNVVDANGTGIGSKELVDLLKSLGYELTEYQAQRLISDYVGRDVTTINVNDFQGIMSRWRNETDVAEELIEAFKLFDYEGTGKVLIYDIEHILTTYGEDIEEDDIKYLLNDANVENNGYIDYKQFVRLLLNKPA